MTQRWLISYTEGKWAEEKLKLAFPQVEVEEILNIPINPTGGNDTRCWKWKRKGNYTVKTGYQVEMRTCSSQPNCSTNHMQCWWNKFWNLNVPPKVKIFIWRAAHDYIPTELNLPRHHVPVLGTCSLCNYYLANTCHSLFFCPSSNFCLKNGPFWNFLHQSHHCSFLEIILGL